MVITKGDQAVAGVEIKFGSGARLSRGNTEAIRFLKTVQNFLIINGDEDYEMSNRVRVCGLQNFLTKYLNSI